MAAAPLPPLFFPTSNGIDDDDEFGDFAFAPPISLQPIATSAAVDEEDEWGDFVKSPIPRSQPPEPPRWERSSGAIPLSIFGEDEAEEEQEAKPSGSADPTVKGSIFPSGGVGGVDPGGKDSFFPPRGVGGAVSGGKDSVFSNKVGRGLEAVAIRDLLDDLYAKVDGKVEGNGVAVVAEEAAVEEEDFHEDGWEFQCAVGDGGFVDPLSVGAFQVAETDKEPKKEILQQSIGNSKQELNERSLPHDTMTRTFDFFSDINHAAGYNGGFNTENGLFPNMVNGNASVDKKQGEAKNAIPEAGVLDLFQWKEEDGSNNVCTNTDLNLHTFGEKFQDLGNLWGSHMEDVTPQFDTGKQDFFAFQQASPNSGSKYETADNVASFNDLLLGLYDEHGQSSSFQFGKSHDNGSVPAKEVNFDNISSKGDLQDSHVPPVDGFLEKLEEQALECVDVATASANFVDFYSKLREVSCFAALDHLQNLKKAHELAVHSDEDAKAREIQLQIQVAYAKLPHKDLDDRNITEKDRYMFQDSCNRLLQDMNHEKFQVFEMEYSLSEKIKLASNDLTSAVELFEHANMVRQILQLGSSNEQQDYIVTWLKILAICEKELQHGVAVLTRSLQSCLGEEILSEPRGRDYLLALGEIYRVAEILGNSFAVYKPWMISNPMEKNDPFMIVNKCCKLWMDGGLRETLEILSAISNIEIKLKIQNIFASIDRIGNLGAVAIQSHMSSVQEPICSLSLLPMSMFPDMEAVSWNGRNYLVKLANLWANLISADPPGLPRLLASEDSGNAN